MGKQYPDINAPLRAFIEAQRMFFVATAPLAGSGHVNLSPKGLDTLRILGPRTVAYLDYIGSGAETIAHVRENGRIVIMFCAFEGSPKILRLHGTAEVLVPADPKYLPLRSQFPAEPLGRALIVISVERITDSCGYGVPIYRFDRHRPHLADWASRKGPGGLREYQREKNAESIDGLPAVTWIEQRSE